MSETQTTSPVSAQPAEKDAEKVLRDLTSAAAEIQSVIDLQDNLAIESIRSIPAVLKQAQERLLEVEARLQQNEAQLKVAQQIIRGANELQTLLDILPVGIVISFDAQNLNMTINQAGMNMLNLSSGMNPSKSAPGGDQLPFKVFRDGQEVPADELPMQYSATHRIALRDVELDVHRSDGKVLNLLEYASPLYDEHGAVRGGLGVLVDITARKAIEKRLLLQYQIARALAEANSINKAAAEILQMICETAGWEFGGLWRVDSEAASLINEGVWNSDQVNLATFAEAIQYSLLDINGSSLPAYVFRSGKPLWLSSFTNFHTPEIIEAREVGLLSAFLSPVWSGDKIIAILEFYSARNQTQDQNHVAMLNAVGSQIGIFIERKLLEQALAIRAKQQQILAQSGIAISASLEYEQRLRNIERVIVPDLADFFTIDIIDHNNMVRRVAAAHIDPGKEQLLYDLQPTRQVDPLEVNNPRIETLLTGQSLLFTDIPESLIEKSADDAEKISLMRQLNPKSSIVVPLIAHGRIMGVCSFVYSDSRRRYFASDLPLTEDIVHRLALSLDNSILYNESQKLNAELERRVDERTNQLKTAINQLTNQIVERQRAEEQVRILNAELELRIAERTSQLELANRELHKEVLDRQNASRTLSTVLKRTRELYLISQSIGTVRTPKELLNLLLTSNYLKDVSRASLAILDKPWIEDSPPPEHCFILAEWNRGVRQARFIDQRFTLEEYGIELPVPYSQPIVIQDVQSNMHLPEGVRKRFADLRTHSLIILPLIAVGEWFGLLSLHFKTRRITNLDDLRHVRGLVDQTAIAVKNMRLLEAESQARKDAETANNLKLKFLAMISHELRTPLTSIKGFATTLLADDVVWSAEKQIDFLQTINRESDKLSDLIEQLLDLSRMEAGILRISPKKLFFNNVLDSVLAQMESLTNNHELVLNIPAAIPPILGDGQRIAQVLTNLVGNAVKFSPVGTKISISAHRSGEMVQVNVADQGPGIPPHDHERVFEAFRQLEDGTGNRTKGAGLGLAICKGIIEAQNGKIWIQDLRSPGTVISFTLPLWVDKFTDHAGLT